MIKRGKTNKREPKTPNLTGGRSLERGEQEVCRKKERGMIRYHIGSTQKYRVILKFEKFSHLSDRFFGLSFSIGFEALSLMFSLRIDMQWEIVI